MKLPKLKWGFGKNKVINKELKELLENRFIEMNAILNNNSKLADMWYLANSDKDRIQKELDKTNKKCFRLESENKLFKQESDRLTKELESINTTFEEYKKTHYRVITIAPGRLPKKQPIKAITKTPASVQRELKNISKVRSGE